MDPIDILKANSFRVTQHRCAVLEYFMKSKSALTHSDLEKKFQNEIDRVSLYRILHSFSEKQLLFKLIDSKGVVSYVYDRHNHSDDGHYYPHYKCKSCNDVVELPELPKAYVDQLKKLNIDELNILAEGTCKECEKSAKE
jgi:Fur family ferric uptake transcriptional regulator